MGIQKNHYVMIGNKFGYDDFYNRVVRKQRFPAHTQDADLEKWRIEVEERYFDSATDGIKNFDGITIISESLIISHGMNSNYVYVGLVLNKSKNHGDLGDYVVTTNLNDDDIGDLIMKAVGFTNDTARVLAFTHYR